MLVPGSTFGLNHPFAWYAQVRCKRTGRQFTYWMNGSQITRELVARHVATHFPGVELLTCDPCTDVPTRTLRPVPPDHYEFGIRRAVQAETGRARLTIQRDSILRSRDRRRS